jgi:hypothetical protein
MPEGWDLPLSEMLMARANLTSTHERGLTNTPEWQASSSGFA